MGPLLESGRDDGGQSGEEEDDEREQAMPDPRCLREQTHSQCADPCQCDHHRCRSPMICPIEVEGAHQDEQAEERDGEVEEIGRGDGRAGRPTVGAEVAYIVVRHAVDIAGLVTRPRGVEGTARGVDYLGDYQDETELDGAYEYGYPCPGGVRKPQRLHAVSFG